MGNKHDNGRQSTVTSRYFIVLVGNYKSGKSSAFRRFRGIADINTGPTIPLDIGSHLVSLDETVIKLIIWDTTGMERVRHLVRSYYRPAHGIIVMYSVISQYTFDSVPYWMEDIKKYAPPDTPVMVLGSMCDLVTERVISYEDGRSLADGNDNLFFEVSSKDGTNIELALMTFVAKIREKHNDPNSCSE